MAHHALWRGGGGVGSGPASTYVARASIPLKEASVQQFPGALELVESIGDH